MTWSEKGAVAGEFRKKTILEEETTNIGEGDGRVIKLGIWLCIPRGSYLTNF